MRDLRGLMTVVLILALTPVSARGEDGYELWLRYQRVSDATLLKQYRSAVTTVIVSGESATMRAASSELTRGLHSLLDATIASASDVTDDGAVIAGTGRSPIISALGL